MGENKYINYSKLKKIRHILSDLYDALEETDKDTLDSFDGDKLIDDTGLYLRSIANLIENQKENNIER